MRLFILSLLSFLFLAAPASAQQTLHATARLYTPVAAAGDGATIPVAVEVTLEKGWKTYWRTPGDAGLGPVFDWAGSDNVESTAVRYPAPHRFIAQDMDNFGYHDHVTFPIDITPIDKGGALSLKLKLDLLVCADLCVPETKNLTLDIPAGAASKSSGAAAYQAAIDALPGAADENFKFTKVSFAYDRDNKNYLIAEAHAVTAPAADPDLFIEHDSGYVFGKPQISYDAGKQLMTFRAPVHSTDPLDNIKEAMTSKAVTLTYVDTRRSVTQEIPPENMTGEKELPSPLAEKIKSIDLRLILIALLGGLVLNLMPCVLPVLSLKILSVVGHGKREGKKLIFLHFMASAFGIICSFWAMALGLVLLKDAGQSVGWGIQFQHPVFLVFLIALLLLFAANLWDLFDIPLPRFIAKNIPAKHEHRPTMLGHFLTGAFATLLATPCTAPFLGTAIGFALARGAYEIFTIFTFLGIGLALPYIVLAMIPSFFKYMPKPGNWMVVFKKILAVALLATAVWLGSVLFAITATPALEDGWQTFNEAEIAPAVADGKTVVVDVTADWCLTCKANKKLVLESDDVEDALDADNIVMMQADWTHRDEAIAAYLRKFDRYGIPFNIVYGPSAPNGIVLPELLTKQDILGAIAEAAGE